MSRMSATELAAKKMLLPYIDKLAFIEIALAQVSTSPGYHYCCRPAGGVPFTYPVRVVSKHIRDASADTLRFVISYLWWKGFGLLFLASVAFAVSR